MDEAVTDDPKQQAAEIDRVNGFISTLNGISQMLQGGQNLVDGMSKLRMAELVAALKAIESEAESLRKEVVEPELDELVSVDETVGDLTRRVGHSKYVRDEQAAIQALVKAEIDPIRAMSVKPKKFQKVAAEAGIDSSKFIGRNEYTYYRRSR